MGRASDDTSTSLLARVRDPEDRRAWGEFERRYSPMIRGWCRRWFPREADDMVQEVYKKLINCIKRFEYDPKEGRFRGWLKTVTNNLMSELREGAPPPPIDGGVLLDREQARQDLLARLAAEYDLELLEAAKQRVRGRVEGRTWSAYVATAEQGRKPAEVAGELGMKVGAVYQARYSVLNELRREIAGLEAPGSPPCEVPPWPPVRPSRSSAAT
jgi:RNA polymerase sigma-70 factor (ECF subfamily)